jgi:hypothetical protein
MNTEQPKAGKGPRQPHQVRLPGFITDKEIGLGDVIKRATSIAGITPCGGCAERSRYLNNWLVFSKRHYTKEI